MKKKFIKEKKG